MEHIKSLLWRNKERIKMAEDAYSEATYVLYEHIRDYIKTIVDRKYTSKHKIFILGGIQLNVEPADYFEPLFCMCMVNWFLNNDHVKDFEKYDSIPKEEVQGENQGNEAPKTSGEIQASKEEPKASTEKL